MREGERQRGREGGRKVEASGPARSLQPAAVRASRFTEPHRTYVCKRLFSQYPESAASARAQPSASTCTLPAHTNCADRPRIPAQAALQANIFLCAPAPMPATLAWSQLPTGPCAGSAGWRACRPVSSQSSSPAAARRPRRPAPLPRCWAPPALMEPNRGVASPVLQACEVS